MAMMNTNRRNALGLAAALSLAPAIQSAAAQTLHRVRLVLAQASWPGDSSVKDLIRLLGSLVGPRDEGAGCLIVLPPALRAKTALSAKELHQRLGDAARQLGIYIAGAAVVREGKASQSEGFLVGPDGGLLLRVPKIMPDVWAGFSDDVAAVHTPSTFPVAVLPFGNVGLLVGEDLYRPSHVRALCFNGAEIILNCAAEVADAAFETRREVTTAIAYCHMAYVAAATGPAPSRTGLWDWQGNVAAAGDAVSVTELIDIESLRIARQQGATSPIYASRVLPPMVRDGVYGLAFKANAAKSTLSASPTDQVGWAAEAAKRIAAQAKRTTPEDQLITNYDAVLMQTPHRVVATAPDRKAAVTQNIKDFLAMAEPYARRPLSKLVMFGEFTFTAAGYRTVNDALSVTLTWPGPELDLIANFAAKHGVYVAAQQLEHDPKFPGRIFNTAFLFDNKGALVSRHRKIQCVDIMGTLPDTTPGSIYDRYVAEYGADSLFKVIDTPLGKLAPMICFENMFPEVAQIYAQQGAEVYLHLTSEGWDPITETRYAWNGARRQHALEATAYLLSVNQGDDPVLRDPYHVVGESQVIDPYGRVTGMLRESRPGVLMARVDLNLLRAARSDQRVNLGIWDDPRVYADAYMRGHGVPNNVWAEISAAEFPYRDLAIYKDVTARYNQRGVFTLPRSAKRPT